MNIIRLTRGGDYITTGQVTIANDGNPSARQYSDTKQAYEFEWSDYFTKDTETVTVTATGSNCTITETEGTDSMNILVESPSYNASVKVSVDITGGETFIMELNVEGIER